MSNSPSILHKFRIFLVAWILAALSLIAVPSTALADRGAPWGMTEPADYYVIVTSADGVNIRIGPDASENKLDFAPYGTRMHVTGTVENYESGTWLEVDLGYIIASAATNERDYRPPAPATPKVTQNTNPAPAASQTASETSAPEQTSSSKSSGAAQDQDSQKSGVSKGLLIALISILGFICILSIILLYSLFMRGKKNPPASPGTPW
ncbi:SH3 domain-containing protein [Varibaculum cambriense]|uniref:SH3 domain-containing protein n=1 Tax=Varibaculum cambriense TaxID=184870 RepID=UPI0029023C71|nr:SH3 domain-containing protein [Varibaculum cambriense]MDU1224081.1 SH3 domain-containing protein [Varibaculum cambriense]